MRLTCWQGPSVGKSQTCPMGYGTAVIFTRSVELLKAVLPVPPTLTRTCTVPPEMYCDGLDTVGFTVLSVVVSVPVAMEVQAAVL